MRSGTLIAMARAAAVSICGVALLVFGNVWALAQQQEQKQSDKRPAEIVLPPLLEAEKPATLAVLDSDGRIAPGITVTLSTGRSVTTDSTGRARFVVTSPPGPFQAEISGTELRASSVVLPPPENPSAEILITDYPFVVAVDDHIAVRGTGFRGDADVNVATINGKAAVVLASSPVSLVLMPAPNVMLGPAELALEIAGRKNKPLSLTMVMLEIERGSGKLTSGMRSKITVHVRGTEQKLTLAVRNLTPGNVELTEGNLQRVITSGGAQNKVDVALKTLRAGDFSVSVRLVRVASGAPDLGLVRRELLAARGLASGGWIGMIDQAIERLDGLNQLIRDEHGISLLQSELADMFSADPPAELAKHLQAAWAALLQP